MVEPNVCGPSVGYFFLVTILAPRILRRLLDAGKYVDPFHIWSCEHGNMLTLVIYGPCEHGNKPLGKKQAGNFYTS
jgi:hypothetical protein